MMMMMMSGFVERVINSLNILYKECNAAVLHAKKKYISDCCGHEIVTTFCMDGYVTTT